jgi:dolichol-phosphate mannosyltransferase
MYSTASLPSIDPMLVISIVCPAFNEDTVLPLFHDALIKTLGKSLWPGIWEIIYVDDGSTDQTWETMLRLIEDVPGAKAIRLARNAGQQHAMTAGIEHARGKAVVTMDTDLQHPPELIFDLVKEWENGATVVQTVRLDDPKLSYFKRITSRMFGNVMGWLSGLDVRPGAADFRLMDRSAVNSLNNMQDNPRLMRAAVASLKCPTRYIDYQPRNRAAGVSKYGIRKMIQLAIQGIWTYSHKLKVAFKCFGVASVLAIVGAILFICKISDYRIIIGLGILCVSLSLWILSTISMHKQRKSDHIPSRKTNTPRYVVKAIVSSRFRASNSLDVNHQTELSIVA